MLLPSPHSAGLRYYKSLRLRILTDAFKRDAVMTKVAEDALTAFMDTPLKFGAISTEPKKEEWRLTRVWARLLADHVNAVITSPGSAANEELSDTLDLVALLSNKLAFIQYHKRLLAKRLLNPVKGLEARALELEGFVISRIQAICDGGLVSGCTSLLADHEASRQFSEELSKSKELEKGLQGGALGAVEDFDMRYLSKRVWPQCVYPRCDCVALCLMRWCRYDGSQEWICPNILLPPPLQKCVGVFDQFAGRTRARHTAEWQPVFCECRVELLFNKKKIAITCDAVVATILSLFETPDTVLRLSEIRSKTGVKDDLLAAVMEQLTMKRPRDGMGTGLLQVCVATSLSCCIVFA